MIWKSKDSETTQGTNQRAPHALQKARVKVPCLYLPSPLDSMSLFAQSMDHHHCQDDAYGLNLTQDPPSIPTVEELSERDLVKIDFKVVLGSQQKCKLL